MKKILVVLVIVALVLSLVTPLVLVASGAEDQSANKDVSVIFSNDLHSHLKSKTKIKDEKIETRAGFAKMKTVIDEINKENPGSFLFDSGDFAMGTPYQAIFKTEASELAMLEKLGYDATTFGNHEFDYKSDGLAQMLNTAKAKGITKPKIVGTNIDWKESLTNKKTKEEAKKLKAAFDNYGVEDYTIVKKDGIKIAVFGLMGEEAIDNAPESGLIWDNYISRAKEIVAEIEQNGEADMIVCLSHSGLDEPDKTTGEDVELAKKVPEIDLILSGHSHSFTETPLVEGNTVIASTGAYAENLGHIVLTKENDGYKVKSYELIKLNNDVKEDEGIKNAVEEYKGKINSTYFSKFGLEYDQVLAQSDFDFTPIEKFGVEQGEEPLGNLISDSYRDAVKRTEGTNYEPVSVAVVPKGTVRDSFSKGPITTADAFNVSSLGTGEDGISGYPLVSVYLTGKELKALAEIDISVSPIMTEARLYLSGLEYKYNDHRLFLNKAVDIELVNEEGKTEKIKNDKLYRVVGGLYSCQMLGSVKDASKGLLSIVPKDKNGKEVKDFNKQIIKSNGGELKEWYALASYVNNFPDKKVPEKYGDTEGRKIDETSFNPVKLVKQPNNFGLIVGAIVLIIILIIVGIILWIRGRRRDRRGYGRSMFRNKKNRPIGGKPQFKGKKVRFRRK